MLRTRLARMMRPKIFLKIAKNFFSQHNEIKEETTKTSRVEGSREAIFCRGCGCRVQTSTPFEEGYIDFSYLEKELERLKKEKQAAEPETLVEVEKYFQYYKNESLKTVNDEEVKSENIDPEKIENPFAADALDEKFFSRFWKKRYIKGINCLRCVKLKHGDVYAFKNDVDHIKSIPRKEFVRRLSKQINSNAFALLVLDVSDISGSWAPELVELINEKNLNCLVVVNKADIIPEGANLNFFKKRLISLLNTQPQRLEGLSVEKIFLVSSRNGEGIAKLCTGLRKLAEENKTLEGRRRVYVLGAVNSGKSSLINAFHGHFKSEMKFVHKPLAQKGSFRPGFPATAAERSGEEEFRSRRENGADSFDTTRNYSGSSPCQHSPLPFQSV